MRRFLAGLALVAILAVLALWIERELPVELPAPTGPYAVGRSIEDWHEVIAWIWYPAVPNGAPAEYAPAAMRAHLGGGPLRFVTHDWAKVRCHSFANAPRRPGSYPVVIFRGGASAPVVNYTTLLEDLASHGYVVVGIDARDRASRNPELCTNTDCYNRLLALWISDISSVADRLGGSVGIFGHSFGGSQAAQFCAHDPRCVAGIDVDGILLGDVVQHGINKPFLFILSDHRNEAGSDRIRAEIQSVRKPIVILPHANHFTFSDDGAILKSRLFRALLGVDGRRQLAQTAETVRGFFDADLKR
ncbi:MAG TPA: hypothetical protein VJZ76_02150 [Thermoanaerobaculia bacterium]|nr:hypothetical protein [Thermoanaerobaculia bacterium]